LIYINFDFDDFFLFSDLFAQVKWIYTALANFLYRLNDLFVQFARFLLGRRRAHGGRERVSYSACGFLLQVVFFGLVGGCFSRWFCCYLVGSVSLLFSSIAVCLPPAGLCCGGTPTGCFCCFVYTRIGRL